MRLGEFEYVWISLTKFGRAYMNYPNGIPFRNREFRSSTKRLLSLESVLLNIRQFWVVASSCLDV